MKRSPGFRSCAVIAAACAAMITTACGGSSTGSSESDPGITKDQIVIGNSSSLSGPNAGYGPVGKAQAACYAYLNAADGGIKMGDGVTRKVKFKMYDDALEPARALQAARRLVSQDHVFLVSGSGGTGANLGTREFYNQQKVPAVFLFTGGPQFGSEVDQFPYSMGSYPAYTTEAAIYVKYIKETWPDAKVALLNDDSGGPFFADGFVQAAKEQGVTIAIHEEYSNADTTIDAKIDRLAKSGADVFVEATTPKFAVQSLKRVKAIGWHPKHIVWGVGSSVGGVLKPAGADASNGVYTALWLKDYSDPAFKDDPDVKTYADSLAKYGKSMDPSDQNAATGWFSCMATKATLEHTMKPTRKAFMTAARSLKDVKVPMLRDGITVNTDGASDGFPLESMQMSQYEDGLFKKLGDVINYEGKTPTK